MAWNASAHPNAIISGDMLEGLPDVGNQTGEFLGRLAPGLGKFILIIGLFTAITGVIVAVVYIIKKKVKV